MNWSKVCAASVAIGLIVVACESGSPWDPTAQNVENLPLADVSSSAISSQVLSSSNQTTSSSSSSSSSNQATSSDAVSSQTNSSGTATSSTTVISSAVTPSSATSSSSTVKPSSAAISSSAISSSSGTSGDTWVSGTTYKAGDQVVYNGKTYTCSDGQENWCKDSYPGQYSGVWK